MTTILAVEEITMTSPELIESLAPGDEVILTKDSFPVARLVSQEVPPGERAGPGLLKGVITYMAPDFDAPLEDMREYMEGISSWIPTTA